MQLLCTLINALTCLSDISLVRMILLGMFNMINRAVNNTQSISEDEAPAVLPTLFSVKIITDRRCGQPGAERYCM